MGRNRCVFAFLLLMMGLALFPSTGLAQCDDGSEVTNSDTSYNPDGSVSSVQTDYADGTVTVDYYLGGQIVQTIDNSAQTGTEVSLDSVAVPDLAPEVAFGDLGNADIAVIGKLDDPMMEVRASQGYDVFRSFDPDYVPGNIAWVEGVIERGAPVIIESALTEINLLEQGAGNGLLGEGFSSFGDELGMFLGAGYTMATVSEGGEIFLLLVLL